MVQHQVVDSLDPGSILIIFFIGVPISLFLAWLDPLNLSINEEPPATSTDNEEPLLCYNKKNLKPQISSYSSNSSSSTSKFLHRQPPIEHRQQNHPSNYQFREHHQQPSTNSYHSYPIPHARAPSSIKPCAHATAHNVNERPTTTAWRAKHGVQLGGNRPISHATSIDSTPSCPHVYGGRPGHVTAQENGQSKDSTVPWASRLWEISDLLETMASEGINVDSGLNLCRQILCILQDFCLPVATSEFLVSMFDGTIQWINECKVRQANEEKVAVGASPDSPESGACNMEADLHRSCSCPNTTVADNLCIPEKVCPPAFQVCTVCAISIQGVVPSCHASSKHRKRQRSVKESLKIKDGNKCSMHQMSTEISALEEFDMSLDPRSCPATFKIA